MSSSEPNFDAKMVDWLYDELDASEAKSFQAHLEAHPEAMAEATALKRTRAAFGEIDDAEPSPSLSTILLHEAAQAVQESPSLWARFAALFQPIMLHPAASAMATLVIVVGVAGALYSRNGKVAMEPTAEVSVQPVSQETDGKAAIGDNTAQAPLPVVEAKTKEIASSDPTTAEPEEVGRYRVGIADKEDEQAIAAATDDGLFSRPGSTPKPAKVEGLKDSDVFDSSADSSISDLAPMQSATVGSSRGFAQAPKPDNEDSKLSLAGAVSEEKALEGQKLNKKFDKNRQEKGKKKPVAGKPRQKKPSGSWEVQQTATLALAAEEKRCRDAGRIANDILDRKPSFYKSTVAKSKAISDCKSQVASEARRRSTVRSKRAAKARKAGGGASKNAKAKAAPEIDEAETKPGL